MKNNKVHIYRNEQIIPYPEYVVWRPPPVYLWDDFKSSSQTFV